jgi:hypothetical protein
MIKLLNYILLEHILAVLRRLGKRNFAVLLNTVSSYTNKASPSRIPEYFNNSSVGVTENEKNPNQSRITEQSDTQISRSEYNKLRNHDNETGLTDNGTNYLPTHDQSENNYCNNDEYKIPVRIQ